jgi:hypothetical protein
LGHFGQKWEKKFLTLRYPKVPQDDPGEVWKPIFSVSPYSSYPKNAGSRFCMVSVIMHFCFVKEEKKNKRRNWKKFILFDYFWVYFDFYIPLRYGNGWVFMNLNIHCYVFWDIRAWHFSRNVCSFVYLLCWL